MIATEQKPATFQEKWGAARDTIIWKAVVEQKGWVITLALLSVALFVVAIGSILTLRSIFDSAIDERTILLQPAVQLLIVLASCQFVISLVHRQVGARIGYHLEYSLRTWLYTRIQSVDPSSLNGLSTGQLITRAMTDLDLLAALIFVIPQIAPLLVIGIALIGIMLGLNVPLTIVSLMAIPVNSFIVKRIVRRLWALSWVALNRRALVSEAIDEPVRGIRVLKAFGREDAARSVVASRAVDAFAVAMTRVRLLARYGLALKAFPVLLNAVIVFVSGYLAAGRHLTPGGFVIFLVFSAVFGGVAAALDELVSGWQYAKTSAGRIFEVVALAKGDAVHTGSLPLPEASSGLVVSASCVDGDVSVSGVELEVGPGELVVLTGPPGSGTSAVAKLAAGETLPSGGSVTLDGIDVATIKKAALRREVRLLLEEPFLFARSVRENLVVGATVSVADDQLRSALHAAAADEVVDELAGGLDESLGDRGMTLSGGQRQRLALARALVAPPRLLVLDQALAAVNPSLEIEILRRIRVHAPQTGVLHVSRRDGPIALADRVVELPERIEHSLGGAAVDATQQSAFDGPSDPRLAVALAELPTDDERPPVTEADATASDEVPTVRNVLAPVRSKVMLAISVLLLLTMIGIIPELLLKFAVDGIKHHQSHPAYLVALANIPLAFCVAAVAYFLRIFVTQVDESVLYILRRRTFQRLSRLGVDYYDRNTPGEVASRVVYDLDRVAAFVDNGVYRLATMIFVLVVTLAVVLVWNVQVFASVAGFYPLLLLLTAVEVPLAGKAFTQARNALGVLIARLHEDYGGRYVIASYGAEAKAEDDFRRLALELRAARRKTALITNTYLATVEFVAALMTAIVVGKAGSLELAGVLSIGSVVVLQALLKTATAPIPALSDVIQQYLQARTSFGTLGDPFRARIFPEQRSSTRSVTELEGTIDLEDVTFTYPGTSRVVLHDVSAHTEPGELVAIVGPTGAGKSSLAKLLARVYDPDQGSICADGVDLRDLDWADYRRLLGVVPQDAFCFRGTIASNVSIGRPEASREEIEAAIRAVGAGRALLDGGAGLDARVDEEGRNLSPVQRQLLALARAWLVEPDVLLLDEATATLSPSTEAEVLDALASLDRTTLVVTHRMEVASRADRVLVVDGGRVVESGRHEDLLDAGGRYADLWYRGADGAIAAGVGTATVGRRRTRRPAGTSAPAASRRAASPRRRPNR